MQQIMVMNSKGGCGKTTVATNLAGLYCARGFRTAIYDLDPQGSAERWTRLRPEEHGRVHGVAGYQRVPAGVTRSWQFRMPPDTERVVVDTPAGAERAELLEQVRDVDAILIPVLPSSIDTYATADFIRDLLLVGKTRSRRIRVGILANRIREQTLAFRNLQRFLNTLQIPVIGYLRDTQGYVYAAEQGLGIHELEGHRARRDSPAWENVYHWLEESEAAPATAYRL